MLLTASDMERRAQPYAAALVERQERQTGSRMGAYEQVAAMVGVSASWLRKLIGRQNVVIEAHEFLNLAQAYRSLCERIEAAAEAERNRARELRSQADEAVESALGPAGRAMRPPGR